MNNIIFFNVILTFVILCVIASVTSIKVRIIDDSLTAFLANDAIEIQPVTFKARRNHEYEEVYYPYGVRGRNDRVITNKSAIVNFSSKQDLTLLFTYPEGSNQHDIVTYAILKFKSDSYPNPKTLLTGGGNGYRFIEITASFLGVSHIEWFYNLYGN